MKFSNVFNFKDNNIGIKDIILLVVLSLICFSQFKIIKLLNKSYYINLASTNKNIENNFMRDYNNFIKDIYNTRSFLDEIINTHRLFIPDNNIKNEFIQNNINKTDNILNRKHFVFYPKTETNDKEFIFTLKLPRNFDEDKLNISFKDKMLNISFEELKEDNNSSYYSSFTRAFFVDSKATEQDITKTIENNTLKIVVPIKN